MSVDGKPRTAPIFAGGSTVKSEPGSAPALRYSAHLVMLIVGFDCLLASLLLSVPRPSATFAAGIDVACALGPLALLVYTLRTGSAKWRGVVTQPGARGAVCLCLAATMFVIGQIVRTTYELVLHHVPFPSWADAAYLGAAVFLLLGILLLLDFPLSISLTARGFVDSMIVSTALITVDWYFVLGPILSGTTTPLIRALVTSYPATDLAVIFAVILLWSQPLDQARRRVTAGLSLAVVVRVLVHFAYAYQVVHGISTMGGLASVGRSVCYTLVVLVAGTAWHSLTSRSDERQGRSMFPPHQSALDSGQAMPVWRALIPYLLTAGVGVLALYSHTVSGDERWQSGVYLGAAILVALVLIHQVLGFVDNARLWHRLGDAYHTLETNNNTLAEANVRLRALWESASTDPLTALPNHRTLMETMNRELERGRRYAHSCSVLFVDLDHFKALNDSYGHLAGDSVLKEFSAIVRRVLRDIDTLGRWGGEEFAVILPETDAATARVVAERIREAVAGHVFPAGGGVRLTCSIGIAAFPDDATERDELVDAADRAMYAAKALGRNQTRGATDPAVVSPAADGRLSRSREESALNGVVEALTAMLDRHDTRLLHARSSCEGLAGRVAEALGLDPAEARMVDLAARLHDIGKVAVPDTVLLKHTPLGEDEWTAMHLHPGAGAEVVSRVPALRGLAPMIRGHHERWDGGGYPDQLVGDDIPLGARIVAVVDAYRAMTTDRPFRRAQTHQEALRELRQCTGSQFDPAVVEAFEKVVCQDDEIGGLEEREASSSVA